jgi:peptidyl-dipeptidase Dcp
VGLAYYSEKVRQAKYSFDESQLKPYFEMKNVLENGVFYAANKLYGISFKERRPAEMHRRHLDLRHRQGRQAAVDLHLRPVRAPVKRGGAWMNTCVRQSSLNGLSRSWPTT